MEESVESPAGPEESGLESLFKIVPVRGKCYVICFSPRHDLTVAEMSTEEIVGVISAW